MHRRPPGRAFATWGHSDRKHNSKSLMRKRGPAYLDIPGYMSSITPLISDSICHSKIW
ncbi:uncharacterized protein PHACADRAFT_246255, partial [Phanerochaete carnosa HHB-10118-sp]